LFERGAFHLLFLTLLILCFDWSSLKKFAWGAVNQYKEETRKAVEEDPEYWLKRPLTEMMIAYAREDVLNLPNVYRQLKAPLLTHNYKLVLEYSREYVDQLRCSTLFSSLLASYFNLE
jgi:hypothetical protein